MFRFNKHTTIESAPFRSGRLVRTVICYTQSYNGILSMTMCFYEHVAKCPNYRDCFFTQVNVYSQWN